MVAAHPPRASLAASGHDYCSAARARFARVETGYADTMADRVPYLVHFPDDKKAVFDVEIGRVAGVGTEILNGWVVDEIKTLDETIDGKVIELEVWVRPRLRY